MSLLPTPRATDGTNGGPNQRGSSGDMMLPSAVVQLLPTPEASRAGGTAEAHRERKRRGMGRINPTCTNLDLVAADDATDWGSYAPAIRQWEQVLGRTAPAPTEPTGRGGGHRLSPAFVEWLMGLPAGHVTSPDIGLTRNQQLKALGNGVVPLQCATALEHLLTMEVAA